MKKLVWLLMLVILAAPSYGSGIDTGNPPTYSNARRDLAVVPLPSPLPDFGGADGMNTVIKEVGLPARTLRCTDATVNHGTTLSTADTGDLHQINRDDSMLFVHTPGGLTIIMGFDPISFKCFKTSYQFLGDPSWSFKQADTLFLLTGTEISEVTLTPPTGMTSSLLFDFKNCAGIPSTIGRYWHGAFSQSFYDNSFTVAYSDSGDQNTATWVLNYTIGKGCRVLNTQTGQVTGWGPNGTITTAARFNLHEAFQTQNAAWAALGFVCTSQPTTVCGGEPMMWQIPTLNVTVCDVPRCGGHNAKGYNTLYNGVGKGQLAARNYANYLVSNLYPSNGVPGWNSDMHGTYLNSNTSDIAPVFFSGTTGTRFQADAVFTFPLQNELDAVLPAGYLRFAHTFSSGYNNHFAIAQALCHVSQDGKYAICSFDGLTPAALGCENNALSCTLPLSRGDVSIIDLESSNN